MKAVDIKVSKVATHEVVRSATKMVVGRYASRISARRAADRLDNEYGAIGYFVRPIATVAL